MADRMNTADASKLLLAQVDKPYVWGANGPDKFDCSGMFYWWSNATGNVRADTTAQGLYNRTQAVSNPKLGDLAFLYSGGYISHVGIMLDSDTVIEARGRAYGVDKTPLKTFMARSGYIWKGVRRDAMFSLNFPPIAPPATKVKFALGFAAQENKRFGGLSSSSTARTDMLRKLNCSIFGVSECDLVMEKTILHAFPNHKSVMLSTGTVGIFFNRTKWTARTHRQVLHGDNYHGALCVPLVSKANPDEGFDFVVNHTRPKTVATDTQKKQDVERAMQLAGTWPVVIAGDFAMDADKVMGQFKRISPDVDTYDPAGNQNIDAMYGGYGIVGNTATIFDPGNIADHKWIRRITEIGE